MSLGTFLQRLKDEGLEIRVQGFFNVESGGFAFSNKHHLYCDCLTDQFAQGECDRCTRGNNSYVTFNSGDGDGIYVAGAIYHPSNPKETLGVITVFDYQFEMASKARQTIENEQVPEFPLDLALQFSDAGALSLGTIEVDRTLLLGDAHLRADGNYAVLDFRSVIKGSYSVITYCEEIATDLEGVFKRLTTTQGLNPENARVALTATAEGFSALSETFDFDPNAEPFPPFIPRAAVALSEKLSHLVERDEIKVEDWATLYAQYKFGSVGTSNRSDMSVSTIWQNAMLAREWDRAAGDIDDATAKILLFDLWTWLYQGRELGDEDCTNYLGNFKYQPTNQGRADLSLSSTRNVRSGFTD